MDWKKTGKTELITAAKYLFDAGTSFCIDLAAFSLLDGLAAPWLGDGAIFAATVLARVVSSLYNYLLNSRVVFHKRSRHSMAKYYLLVLTQMLMSALLVFLLNLALPGVPDVALKVPVDLLIFVVNSLVQRCWIFR